MLLVITGPSFAAGDSEQDANHFSADVAALSQRASQVTPPVEADVLFLEDQETVVFDGEGKVVRSRYVVYKVLTQRGAEGWGQISANWEPWHEERPTLRARVITSGNVVHVLDANTITDAPAKENADNVFSDRRVLRAPLPAIAPGSLVEEEQVSTESAPFFGAGTVERFYFGGSVPVEHTHLTLDAPAALSVRYAAHLLPGLQPQRQEANGRVRITFDYGPLDPLEKSEPELPSDVPFYPSVTFSTGGSWQQVADEYGKLVDKRIAGADLTSLVGVLITGKDSREKKIAALLQYVSREVRYTGVEFGESAIVPHAPTETLARKYGDCKDKSTLLVAMLRAAGIPAYLALLNAGSREDVAADLPGIGMFDHAIVYVPGAPDLWIDATDEYARLGEIPVDDQERLALIVRPGTNQLKRTSATSSTDNALIEEREVDLAEHGPARVIETSCPHGGTESSYRRFYSDKENKAVREGLTNYVKAQYLAEKLDRMDRSDPGDLTKPFQLMLESDRAKRGDTELNMAVVAIRLEGLFSRLPADLREREDDGKANADDAGKPKQKRTSDYQLPEAFVTEWHYTIVPPPGFTPKPLPADASLTLGPSTLTETFSADKNRVVHAILRFDTVKRRLTVAEAAELRDHVTQLIAGEPVLVYFEPVGEALASQGKVREAVQSYRDLIALYPKEAVHHLQIAKLLLDAGLGESARAEAQAAVKLEPTSALAEKTLAEILEFDLVGRRFRPGSDYAGAEAAFRAAEKLDPDDKATVANLAILLEYDSWGLRYGPTARLKDAIAEYRKITPDDLDDLGVSNNLAFALFYDGQFSDAKKNALTLNPQPNALIVACEAALNGSQRALAEARKRAPDEDQFKQIASSAGDMLANLRKYSLAADLEEAGASGAEASETAAFASLYRKTQPHEQLVLGDNPVGVATRFQLMSDDPNLTLEQLRPICSRNGSSVLARPETAEDLVKVERRLLSGKARHDQFPDVGTDISITRAQPKVQGDDLSGYKVVFWSSANYKTAFYVVKEDGHYKLLATSQFDNAVGLEVLDRIAANNLAGARILLDWLREDMHLPSGDDPIAGTAFSRFWTKGRDADAASMKTAAAMILTTSKATASRGLPILEEARNSAHNDGEKVNITIGLAAGYGLLHDYEKALTVNSDLAKQYPESQIAFLTLSRDLLALGRIEEADRVAQERLQRIPDDLDAVRTLATIAAARGDYVQAHNLYKKLVEEGKADVEDLNMTAWQALFVGKVEPADIEDALKAAQLQQNAAFILHTLGCLYAVTGKTKQAYEVLIQGMDALNEDQPDDDYRYAFGLIAEDYGERDVALASYTQVKKPEVKSEIVESSYYLVQARLRSLRDEKQ